MNGMKNLRAIVEAMGRGGAEEVVGVPRRGAALIAMGALLILLQLKFVTLSMMIAMALPTKELFLLLVPSPVLQYNV